MYEIKEVLRDRQWIREIEFLKEERKRSLLFRNCKVVLIDFSIFHIKEIWKGDELLKYSYYLFTANNRLIVGWDNAPHHPGMDSFPHHKHHTEGLEQSHEKNLLGCNRVYSKNLLFLIKPPCLTFPPSF